MNIPKGSVSSIISYLDKNNLDVNELDRILIRFFGKPQSGWISMNTTNFDGSVSKENLL